MIDLSIGRRRWAVRAGLCISLVAQGASAGRGFTLVATEENTKDMSVNLGVDAMRGDTMFGGQVIQAPTAAGADRDILISVLNHDSGVLDIQHTFLALANFSSRILLQFQTLQRELQANCWTRAEAGSLRATLRLYLIPPYGPKKHNRLLGISPSVHLPPAVGLDPPPANVGIAVHRQTQAWVEGAGQNSFFTATVDPEFLLDTTSVGVRAPGSVWEGVALEGSSDVCLNRERGLEAIGNNGNRAPLCYDDDPNWQPWMEWDVSEAVRFWLNDGFDPANYHGFALYQNPGLTRDDQVRISPEVENLARSRAVVSFASSSGAADCVGAGGKWGGRSEADTVYANQICMTTEENDFEPNLSVPRFIQPLVHPEWAPQLVIESSAGDTSCPASIVVPEAVPDAARGERVPVRATFVASTAGGSLRALGARITPEDGALRLRADGCQALVLAPGDACEVTAELASNRLGRHEAELSVRYAQGDSELVARALLVGSVSEDADGIPDAVEDAAPFEGDANQDGVPDRQQSNVASLPLRGAAGRYVSFALTGAERISGIEQLELAPSAEIGGVRFGTGFWSFEIAGLPAGGQVDVELRGSSEEATVYYVLGAPDGSSTPTWSNFGFDGRRGARVFEHGLSVRWVDGQWGDLDGAANGVIRVMPGGPGSVDYQSFRLTDASVGAVHPVLLVSGLAVVGVVFSYRRRRTARSP